MGPTNTPTTIYALVALTPTDESPYLAEVLAVGTSADLFEMAASFEEASGDAARLRFVRAEPLTAAGDVVNAPPGSFLSPEQMVS